MNKYIFFTLNNFSQDDGGTLRMRGIVNALAESGVSVTLISNTTLRNKFHHSVNHILLNYYATKRYKQLFQLSIAILPISLYRYFFSDILKSTNKIIEENNLERKSMIFFEYLDNSVGYLLKQNGIIQNYINDVHGIAPLEFKLKKSKTLFEKFENFIKLQLVQKLDQKVITNAKGLFFVSYAMQKYYETLYPTIRKLDNKIVRDGTSEALCSQKAKIEDIELLSLTHNIKPNDNVVLFLGDFKDLGGVIDLINAFVLLVRKDVKNEYKLLLVGNGERFQDAQELVQVYRLENQVIFVGRIEYNAVRSYQELANVIVCPDKQHEFSELIPHIKYFDSLVSGKIVINGSFRSIKEINTDEQYSINFKPSDIIDLSEKIEYVFGNIDLLKDKYKNNAKIVCQKFAYDNSVKVLLH